jgi:hypothetical protein
MQMRVALLTAIGLAVCALCACATPGAHVPGSVRGGKVALVVNAPLDDVARKRMARALPFEVVDLESARAVLFSPDLAAHLDDDAPDTWPAEARAAWIDGAAGCRARAVRPPWGDNALAVSCAAELAHAVIEALAIGEGATTIVVVEGNEEQPHWRARAFAPGADAQWQDTNRPELLASMIERVWRGHVDVSPRVVARVPVAPTPDHPWLHAARAQAFDPPGVAGCVRPMPSALDVAPDAPMAELVELMWARIPASVRTGAATTCTVRAFSPSSQDVVIATIDCEGLPLAVAQHALREDKRISEAATDLGVALTSTLAFDGCNMQTRSRSAL